ncbi:hypothetical protein [Salipiger abyssi]|uniref:hypothetical protein n=1 Tax=Salipiger abyssi TaxID=1250539 RepID=UPI001A8FF7DA|nr:hypothetical protein [Salipiger abyssi]MBN9887460.1 hypothetical protein [Salipiger abyssi]
MSAPDTNLKKQERQHRAPLWGIWAGLGIVVLLFLGWLGWVIAGGEAPEAQGTVMDDFTGQSEQVNEDAAVERDAQDLNSVPAGAD